MNRTRIEIFHIIFISIMVVTILVIYYKWQNWFPWFWDYFMAEYRAKVIGSLLLLPLFYSLMFLRARSPIVIISFLSYVALFPRLIHYYDYLYWSIVLNCMFLLLPITIILVVSLEIKQRRDQKKALRQAEENRQIYTSQILKAQEDERRRIAQEMHDDTIQELLLIANNIEDLILDIRSLGASKIEEKAEKIKIHTSSVIRDARRFCLDLGPSVLDDLGLVPALTWLIDRFNQENAIKANIIIEGNYYPNMFNNEVETGVYRIAQEAFNNIRSHSFATLAELRMRFDKDSIMIAISDNGKGFILPKTNAELTNSGKLGLMSMQDRANFIGATMSIQSELSKGTLIKIALNKQLALR